MAQPLIGQTLSHYRIMETRRHGIVYKDQVTELGRFVQRYAALIVA